MKIRVQHRTEYLYSQPVRNNCNELRLQPPQSPRQSRDFWLLKVLPATRVQHFIDFHRNSVQHFELEEAHSRLVIEATSTVHTSNVYAMGEPAGVLFSALANAREDEETGNYLNESRYVKISPDIWKAALDVKDHHQDVFTVARLIMENLHDTCRYTPGVTTVDTGSVEFFAFRHGVCQDFTHLMLAMCRTLGIPARYVSGYLYDPKRRELRGAHASHAWVEVFLPGLGWFGLDPTNRRLVDELYVTIAFGRDYDDAAPVKGTFVGTGSRIMNVTVNVEEG